MSYMYNEELFKIAMATMTACNYKATEEPDFKARCENWCRDVEYSRLAFEVYNHMKVKTQSDLRDAKAEPKYVRQLVFGLVDIICDEVDDIAALPVPVGTDDSDCWLGCTAGDFFGLPNRPDVMDAVEFALEEFAKDTEVGYLGEIIKRHPEWNSLRKYRLMPR